MKIPQEVYMGDSKHDFDAHEMNEMGVKHTKRHEETESYTEKMAEAEC